MDGFKKSTKMQCFKEGGSVKYESRKERKEEMSADIKQDKAIVKKAFKQHDKAEHGKSEATEIKLKKGGRAKKELGSARKFIKPAAAPSGAKGGPNKYKVGGSVTNVYEAKKKAGDIDAIEAVKNIKPGVANTPSKASVISKNTPAKFCGGKSVKKYDGGGSVFNTIKEKIMGTPKQNAEALANEKKYLAAKQLQRAAGKPMGVTEQLAAGLAGAGQSMQGQGAISQAERGIMNSNIGAGDTGSGSQDPAVAGQKKGGKVKKMNTGGTCS